MLKIQRSGAIGIGALAIYSCSNKKVLVVCDPLQQQQPIKEKKVKTINKWDLNWDLMENSSKASVIPLKDRPIRQIILIRHGQYIESPPELPSLTTSDCSNDSQQVLTDLGRKQATATGTRLKSLVDAGVLFPIDTVYYSIMARATETCKMILSSFSGGNVSEVDVLQKGIPDILQPHQVQACSMIQEGAVCKPEPPFLNWPVSDEDFIKQNARVEAAFKNYICRADPDVKRPDYSTVFVCHGNIIRYFVLRVLQLPPEAWSRLTVYNASITIVEIYPSGKVSLGALGDVGHLPPEMITYNQSK